MKQPLILLSVIIPVFNVARYLSRCLDSVVNQAYRNLDIILVDDGSTDGSGGVCDDYQKKDSRIRVIHQENKGLAEARNIGLSAARGGLIGFVDSDDWIEKDMYGTMINNHLKTDADIIACGLYYADDTGTVEYNWKSSLCKHEILTPFEALYFLLEEGVFNVTWNKIYIKTLFANIKFPKGKICEDTYIMYKILLAANKISMIDECKYYYFQRAGSLIKSTGSKRFLDEFDALYSRHRELKTIPNIAPQIITLSLQSVIDCLIGIIHFFGTSGNSDINNLIKKYFKENSDDIREYCRTSKPGIKRLLLLKLPLFLSSGILALWNTKQRIKSLLRKRL
jgi:glycosyltransferase involved in cell wall biosynthesis